ncbi:colony stimulating factor 3 (granulocyte) a [Hypomesus transpacificus]|uniref:colony stimulating factor 3 (granulocyte) a n=1 Tax=Hypomesus transpacificus TaxID=137520 RepID=UPI001F080FF6|nr:colony stimulating factor 3 (granulocyte) a [Hypomesus transpacificus]
MKSLLIVALQCCVAALVCAAPVHLPDDADFEQTLEQAQGLVEKILRSIPSVQKDQTLDPSSQTGDLQLMVKTLGIPPAPTFKAISTHFTLEVCLQRMSLGLQLHHSLLGALTPASSSATKHLQADLRDLQALVNKMQGQSQLSVTPKSEEPGFTLNISGSYEVQVATHLALLQLRTFSHDLVRSLRNIRTTLPGTQG